MICIKNGTLHTAVSKETFIADILIDGGKIVKIGKGLSADGAEVIDATGLQVYPGFVEAHCHIGLDGYGIGYEGHDYNELNDPVTPQVQAIDGINPFDPCMKMAAKAGVTCFATGPGSSNSIGGTFAAIKPIGTRVDNMIVKFPVAMKCAFGENPKRCYQKQGISSRMTNAAKIREALNKAKVYKAKIEAAKAGARIATMPNITEDMFCQGAMTADYDTVLALTDRVTQLLTQASTARIEKEGHVLTLDLRGRSGVPSSGVYRERGQAGNLPSGEAYIAPLEHGSNGSMVIDGSMVGIGLLDSSLEVRVQDGKLVSIQGKDAEKVSILLKTPQNATLCELGIGTNYAAQLIGVILEDEKAYHTVHIAFGTNVGFGGANQADCHMDGVIRNPTLYLDDILVMKDGEFQI